MQQYFALSPLIWLGLTCFTNVLSSCPPITVGDLGSTTNVSDVGLVPLAATPAGEPVNSIPVRIMDYMIVCDASGMNRSTSTFVSVLVQFQCDFPSGTGTLADCDGNTSVTRQYQFSCISGEWNGVISGNDLFVQTLNPTATFATPLDNQCRRCINDQQSTNPNIDDTTHCDPCGAQCNQGQRRCFIGQGGDQCCNFYLQGVCVPECPSALTSDTNFDCVCPFLSLENGVVSYSPENRNIGSMATHTCSPGYRLSPQGGETRTCTENGWNSQDVTCEFIQCPDRTIANGTITINPLNRSLNSLATYMCSENFSLKGDPASICQMNSTWNNTVPECVDCSAALMSDPNCFRCGIDQNSYNQSVCVECKEGNILQDGICEIGTSTDFAVRCPDLTISSGIVTITPIDQSMNSITTYSCNSGFTLRGAATRTCQSDGTWTGMDPLCESISGVSGNYMNGIVLVITLMALCTVLF